VLADAASCTTPAARIMDPDGGCIFDHFFAVDCLIRPTIASRIPRLCRDVCCHHPRSRRFLRLLVSAMPPNPAITAI
jgi:hypothetical protein